MANTLFEDRHGVWAEVNEAPINEVFGTPGLNFRHLRRDGRGWFSCAPSGNMNVTLQYKRAKVHEDWVDYKVYSTLQMTEGVREELKEGGANIRFRAIVKQSEYINGACKFGFDW